MKNKAPIIAVLALILMSVIGAVLYTISQPKILDNDDFFESKYLEVEKVLNTKLDYDAFIKGSNVLTHEIKNEEKIVRWQDGDRTVMYVTDMNNTLLMVVYFSYLKDMNACISTYDNNKKKAQKIYKTRAKDGGLDYSSELRKDNKQILLYCANTGDKEFNSFVSYTYIKEAP